MKKSYKTLDEFMEKLSKTPRTWKLHGRYAMIRNAENLCPLVAIAGERQYQYNLNGARKVLDMPAEDFRSVYMAADTSAGYDPAVRARLLEACGL